jgi:F0F1-type ATP synthase delta subunit
VTRGAAASRYARALFDVVLAESPAGLDAAQADIQGFADLFSTNDALAGIAANPAIPVSKKAALVKALVARAGTSTPAVGKLLPLLADRDRLMLLPEIARAFRARLMDHQNIVRSARSKRASSARRAGPLSSRRAWIRRSSAAPSRASAASSTTAA